MAIDFMIMPVSRYISGDFVTPTMEFAWQQDIPYKIVGPDGNRQIPANTPFGGPDAPERRLQIVDMVLEDLRGLSRVVSDNLWDELSSAPARFHRVDPQSFQALREYFAEPKKKSLFAFRRVNKTSHCTATIFFPFDFESPTAMTLPFDRTVGSTNRALRELAEIRATDLTRGAAETLRQALADSAHLQLPMIVDW